MTTTATKIDRHLATAIRATLRRSRAAHRHLIEAIAAGAATVEEAIDRLLPGGLAGQLDEVRDLPDLVRQAASSDALPLAESRYLRAIAPAIDALAEAW